MVVCTLHLSEATCLNHNSLHHQMHRIFRNADAKVDIFLEIPKFFLAFHSFIRTFGFAEGTLIRKSSNKFGFSLIYSYLCTLFKVYEICKTLEI